MNVTCCECRRSVRIEQLHSWSYGDALCSATCAARGATNRNATPPDVAATVRTLEPLLRATWTSAGYARHAIEAFDRARETERRAQSMASGMAMGGILSGLAGAAVGAAVIQSTGTTEDAQRDLERHLVDVIRGCERIVPLVMVLHASGYGVMPHLAPIVSNLSALDITTPDVVRGPLGVIENSLGALYAGAKAMLA